MSETTPKELLERKGYYPVLFYICKHSQMHRHKCDDCQKHMLEGEEQVLTAYYNSTYDHVGGPKATLNGYDITCRRCHPGPIDKGFHYGYLRLGSVVV